MSPKETEPWLWAFLLAAIFIVSGILKIAEIEAFHEYVYLILKEYSNWDTAGLLARWWCWLEILGGLSLLVPQKETRLSGAVTVGSMLVVATFFLMVAHGKGMESCLCFGSAIPKALNHFSLNLLRNVLLFTASIRFIVLCRNSKDFAKCEI